MCTAKLNIKKALIGNFKELSGQISPGDFIFVSEYFDSSHSYVQLEGAS